MTTKRQLGMDPLTSKGSSILNSMRDTYGEKKGEQVFYASRNSGKITGVDAAQFRDGSNGVSLSEVYAASPELQAMVKRAEDARRKARDCNRFGKTSADAMATIGTSRKNVTRTGIK